jgi:hypothetical protein
LAKNANKIFLWSSRVDISFDKLKGKVKAVVSERMRHWRTDDGLIWSGVFEVLPEVIIRSMEEKGSLPMGRDDGRGHRTLDACNDMLAEIEAEAHKIVDAWDVRCVGKLIELFPEALPKKYQKAKFDIDMDDDGDWNICFRDSMKMRF